MRQLREDGADVTCLARGDSGAVPPGAHHVRVDRAAPGAYDGVRRNWDEVIELAYAPELVGPAIDALGAEASHWTLVSSVSVYDGSDQPDADETASLVHIRYWAGPRSLPLWLPESDAAFARRSGRAFLASGGRLRPLKETLTAVLADERARGVDRPRRSGLTADEEATVVRALAARLPGSS